MGQHEEWPGGASGRRQRSATGPNEPGFFLTACNGGRSRSTRALPRRARAAGQLCLRAPPAGGDPPLQGRGEHRRALAWAAVRGRSARYDRQRPMGFQIRHGAFPQLVQRLGGTLLPASGESEVGRGRVSVGDVAVLLIAYYRSSDAWKRGYRGGRPDQTVSLRGVPPAQCSELEALLLRKRELQDLIPGPRGGSGARAASTSRDRRSGED